MRSVEMVDTVSPALLGGCALVMLAMIAVICFAFVQVVRIAADMISRWGM